MNEQTNLNATLICFILIVGFSYMTSYAARQPFETVNPVSFYAGQGGVSPVVDGNIRPQEWRFSSQSAGASGSYWKIRWDRSIDRQGGIQSGLIESAEGGYPSSANDCSLEVYSAYDDEFLYFAINVTDDTILTENNDEESEDGETWLDDSVEIFIDGDWSRFDTPLTQASEDDRAREFGTGGQFVLTANNARRDVEAGDPVFGPDGDWYARARKSSRNYSVEFQIRLSKIGNPKKGSRIGLNVAVNDADGGSQALYQMRWSGEAHRESTYGTLLFGPREITAPHTSESIAVDGVMDEPAWETAAVETLDIYSGVMVETKYPETIDDIAFEARFLHDDIWLYAGVTVTDDYIISDTEASGSHNGRTWYDDSIEIFIDRDFNHGSDASDNRYASRDYIEGEFVVTPVNATRDYNTTNNPQIGSSGDAHWWPRATQDGNAWTGEMRFRKEVMTGDGPVGFTFVVNDDDPGGAEPDHQLRWQGTPHVESSYGVLYLGQAASDNRDWSIY